MIQNSAFILLQDLGYKYRPTFTLSPEGIFKSMHIFRTLIGTLVRLQPSQHYSDSSSIHIFSFISVFSNNALI